ncbi:MAG: cytochrome P450 [Cytophagaceae bacterium]|nr:cytochrome P450 [Cytophagaceae bacterium]
MKIPVVPSSKPAGHLKEYVSNPLTFLNDNWKKQGDIFRFRLAHRSLLVSFNPEHIKQLLQEDHSAYRKSLGYRKLRLLLGDGLFTGDGKSWLQQRRLSQPAFHKERLSHYFLDMDKAAKELAEGWKNQGKINVIAEMTAVTLKIILCLLRTEFMNGYYNMNQ